MSNHISSFLDIFFVWTFSYKWGCHGGRVKSNFMGKTMRFLFQGSPAKQKMETDVSFTVLGTPHFQPDLDITDCLCAIWTISLPCRAVLCVPVAQLVSKSRSLEPAPMAALAKLRGVGLPETLSRSAPHSSHTTLYYWANRPKYKHCPVKK